MSSQRPLSDYAFVVSHYDGHGPACCGQSAARLATSPLPNVIILARARSAISSYPLLQAPRRSKADYNHLYVLLRASGPKRTTRRTAISSLTARRRCNL
eukprot:1182175-Prorocentrum_minimum.AAC.2